MEGFTRHPREFRFAPEDEASLAPSHFETRLAREFVLGAFASTDNAEGPLLGIGGLARFSGAKLRHKALVWGMYVRDAARGLGIGSVILDGLLAHARSEGVEIVQLTVAAHNARALRVYERSGFTVYGTERASVKLGEGAAATYIDEALMAVHLAELPR
jgi:ribosomal protein S18 acetylase RimI-like enzyme